MSENMIDYSNFFAEIYRRLQLNDGPNDLSDAQNAWLDLFHEPDVAPNQKSFKALKEMKKELTECQKHGDQCAICIDQLKNSVDIPEDYAIREELRVEPTKFRNTIVLMPCGHRFHMFCLTLWLEKKQTCPICRAKVKTDGEHEEEARQQRVSDIHDSMFS